MESSAVALKTIIERSEIQIVEVLTARESSFNSDFVDLTHIARIAEIPVKYTGDESHSSFLTRLRDLDIDVIFVIGWSRLLQSELIKLPRFGAIGFHPAQLPCNRGRHPIIWALALGLEETASTLFKLEDGADTGPIISQMNIPITFEDDANRLYQRVLAVLPSQVNSIVDQLKIGKLDLSPQDHSVANTWRKRSPLDGLIDWRMSAEGIYNLTRALTYPYAGAEFVYRDNLVKLWQCEVFEEELAPNIEPGKVIGIDSRGPIIKTGLGRCGGAVRLLKTGDCLQLHIGDYL